jgi:lipopolysaccharide export system protein LptA
MPFYLGTKLYLYKSCLADSSQGMVYLLSVSILIENNDALITISADKASLQMLTRCYLYL